MKNIRSKRSNKPLIIVVVAIVISILGAGLTVAYYNNLLPIKTSDTVDSGTNIDDVDFNEATPEQVQDGANTKSESLDEPEPESSVDPSSGKTIVSISIPSINQTSDTVRITSQIETVTNTGTCTLKLSKDSSVGITKTAPVQALNNSSTCKGFSINSEELEQGTWSVSLTFENSTHKATTQQTFEVK